MAAVGLAILTAWLTLAGGLAAQAQARANSPQWLLAQAADAFGRNQRQEHSWTKSSREVWSVTDGRGRALQQFPTVTIESVVRNDGTRCNAVVAWSDGVPGHLLQAEEQTRCESVRDTASDKFDVAALLTDRLVKRESQSAAAIVLTVFPDVRRPRSPDLRIRCAAAIRATVVLDPATFFPRHIDGQVMDDGCDETAPPPPTYYGEPPAAGTVGSTFRKGSTFAYDYEEQKDRFSSASASFWLLARWRYDQRIDWRRGDALFYWGREVEFVAPSRGERLIVVAQVTAEQFGATSKIIIK
jgi:hypothetical protein